jgi:HSP20 family molecular chaperone IbpA
MSRMTPFSSPLLLGFDTMEKTLERIAKGSEGYPPYNIERIRASADGSKAERLRITLAVAGFCDEDLEVTTEENQLVIRGRQSDNDGREYLHRGIAARQFQRMFVLADGHAGCQCGIEERVAVGRSNSTGTGAHGAKN